MTLLAMHTGPGAYREMPSPRGPAYTMDWLYEYSYFMQTAKLFAMHTGPGAYGEMPSPRGPAYTMAGRPSPGKNAEDGSDTPGPG